MNSIAQLLAFLAVIVVTSGIVLLLVQSGIITVRADGVQEQVLNMNFIPYTREGHLLVQEFQFCGDVSEQYQCLDPKMIFHPGENVHFRFVVESSTFQGEVKLVENYRIKGTNGEVLLNVDETRNFHVEAKSRDTEEKVAFRDFIQVAPDTAAGEYTLELVLENPLLNKRVERTERFTIG